MSSSCTERRDSKRKNPLARIASTIIFYFNDIHPDAATTASSILAYYTGIRDRDVHGSDRIVGFLGSDRTGSDPIRRSEIPNDFYV